MRNLYGGMMMPEQIRTSRESERQNQEMNTEEMNTESDDVLPVIDGRDYSIMGKISKEEKNDLNANGRGGGGPAFNEAEKFFYHEATTIYTRKNLEFLINMLPGDKNLSLSKLKEKYSKIIKTENHKKIMMEQLSCGCQRSKPDIFEADDKDKAEVITMTHQFGIKQDLDDIMSLKFKVMKLKDEGILKHDTSLPKKLQNAEDNVKLFIEALELIENKGFSVKCGKTDTREKNRLYNDNKLSSLPTPPTTVSGVIYPRTTNHKTKKNTQKSKSMIDVFKERWEKSNTHNQKRKIISDMIDHGEAMKRGDIRKVRFSGLMVLIENYLDQMRNRAQKRKKGKSYKRKKKNTNKRSKK